MSLRWVLLAVALAAAGVTSARAAGDEDLKEIRRQIEELRSNYEARIKALEERLKEAETRAAAPAQPPAPVPTASSPPGTSSISAFNPAISAILAGSYSNLSRD